MRFPNLRCFAVRIDTLEKIFREAFAIRFFRLVEAEKFWSVNGESVRGRSMTVGYGHEQRLVVLPVVSDLQEDRIRLPGQQGDVAVVSKHARLVNGLYSFTWYGSVGAGHFL